MNILKTLHFINDFAALLVLSSAAYIWLVIA